MIINKKVIKPASEDRIHTIAGDILKEKTYFSPVDLLMKRGILSRSDYEDWRLGRVPYLEKERRYVKSI